MARAGKDTFARLCSSSNLFAGRKIRTLAFADELKRVGGKFLRESCNVPDVTTLTGAAKTDVRPFLVWFGCYMRKQDPLYWVKPINAAIEDDNETDLFIVTDVRFSNESDWVHSLFGKVIHVKRYQADPYQNSLVPPANEEEALNDPLVDRSSDIHVRWPTVTDEHLNSLQKYVDEAILRL